MDALNNYGLINSWDQPLVDVVSIGDQLAPYMENRLINVRSNPPDEFPIRRLSLGGRPRGDGGLQVQWRVDALPSAAVKYIYDTYLSGKVGADVTIVTRFHQEEVYKRYNAWIERPRSEDGFGYRQGLFTNIILRLTLVEYLPEV